MVVKVERMDVGSRDGFEVSEEGKRCWREGGRTLGEWIGGRMW